MSGPSPAGSAAVSVFSVFLNLPAAQVLSAPLLLAVVLRLMAKRHLLLAAARGYTSLRPPVGRLDDYPDLLFVADMAVVFGCCAATIARRVSDGTFPVPPITSIDRKLRWSRVQVCAWLETGDPLALAGPRRLRPRARSGGC